MPYRTSPRDRAKSLGLVVAVHLALGLALVAGLRGPQLIRAAQAELTTFNVPLPPAAPPPPPRPAMAAAKRPQGATDLPAKAAPIVLPPPPRPQPLPTPLPVAREAGPVAATAASAGAGLRAGNGIGAGAAGTGDGGGGHGGADAGAGAGSGAHWLGGGLSRGDYRVIRSFEVPTGSAAYAIRVDAFGRATDCRARQSSGDPELDATICALLLPRLRFDPARDASGRPRPDEITYIANWARR